MKRYGLAVVFMMMCLTPELVAFAAPGPSDGFVAARKIESRFFSIQLARGVDEPALVMSLDIGPEHKVLAGQDLSADSLGELLDTLFIFASKALDMELGSFRGSIKVLKDQAEIGEIFQRLYGSSRSPERGFYIYEMNTIYVTEDYFTKEIVGHEMGHAIVGNYFVVQPPEKVHEVLAGYVEHRLRKKSLE